MNSQNNISHYFENILSSIKNMEQCTQVFSQLHSISEDISHLEKYMKGSFATLDNHFQTYVQHIDLLSSLIDFQRKIIHFKTAEEMTSAVFSYIKENIEFDHAFIHLTVGEEEKDTNLILPEPENKELYEKFLYENNNYEKIKNIVSEKELGLLLSNVQQFESEQLPWKILGAKSVIIFPLRMHGRFFGFGILIGKEEPLLLKHLSFINLILGMLSLLLYQHFYFFNLKQRLFKQVKLQKVLEEVKYAEYFDKGPLFIYSLDNKGVILHANQAALENTKLHKENVIGEKFLKFLPEEHRKSFESILHGLGIGELQFYKCQMYAEDEFVHIWNFFITKMELNERFKLNIIFAVDV
ncbi:MAG: PAS domain S-box protein, partial [Nitrosopumilaceae archaeon]|nr:PAS domain S-box protein [Nitrosopumilaceae archaeon]NIU86821.1 PAS domain S-box protein [Nitrosopumilaceae archaeon]NIV65480.1 PAS domain S-box protein [Nitrosopumilaceae archaeon]NIX62431.1 PAS domain S-box protein [Nitrosopumilaceae archaeon]